LLQIAEELSRAIESGVSSLPFTQLSRDLGGVDLEQLGIALKRELADLVRANSDRGVAGNGSKGKKAPRLRSPTDKNQPASKNGEQSVVGKAFDYLVVLRKQSEKDSESWLAAGEIAAAVKGESSDRHCLRTLNRMVGRRFSDDMTLERREGRPHLF